MAIAFVGSATDSTIQGGTATIDLTTIAGLAEGHIVIAFCHSTEGTVSTPSGWTLISSDTNVNAGTGQAGLFYKIQTSSLDTSVSFWDAGDSEDATTAIAFAFSDVDAVTPLDGVAATKAEGSGAPNPGAITPTSNDCMIVVMAGSYVFDTSPGTITNYTHPTPNVVGGNDDHPSTSAGAYRLLSGGASVSENPGAWSAWSSGDNVAFTIALRPGTAAGQPFYIRDIIQFPSSGISII